MTPLTVAEYVRLIRAAEDEQRRQTEIRALMIARAVDLYGDREVADALGLHRGHVWRIADNVRKAAADV